MKFLLTNDDGIDAPGLAALRAAAQPLGETFIAAPAEHQSGCSHRVTTGAPIRVSARGPGCYAVAGTPADCARVGLRLVEPHSSVVLSGINAGGNLGADVWHSGTVAAVREAVLHGWRGIAFSQYIKRGVPVDWDRAAGWVTELLRDLLARPWAPGVFWNVNLPHVDGAMPEAVVCPLDPSPLPVDFRQDGDMWQYAGDYHRRQRKPGGDVDVCFGGRIAVTRLSLFLNLRDAPMAEPRPRDLVLLVVAAFSRHDSALAWARERLEQLYGPVTLTSPAFDFQHTRYYEPTMGPCLRKQLLAFERLVDPDCLTAVKLRTNALERELAESGTYSEPRPLNLDPGVLSLGKFLLATTKDQAHRVYLRDGIFAEVTLHFVAGEYVPWPWTYADYREADVRAFLKATREFYKGQLTRRTAGP